MKPCPFLSFRYFIILLLPLLAFSLSLLAAPNSVKKIVILGDSLTAGYGVAKSKAFPQRLEEKFQKEGHRVEVINSGISGSTTASGVQRLKWVLKSQPQILVIALGSNDGLRGFKLEATEKNLSKMIKLGKEKGLKVILAGLKLPINYGPDYRKKFSSLFPRLAKKYEIALIPFLLKGVGGEVKLNLADGIHPNEKGHEVIAETVFKVVKRYL